MEGPFGKYKTADEIPEAEKRWYFLGDKYRPTESIDFVKIKFNGIWTVRIPKFLHDYHDWWDYWEKECHLSMQKWLKPGMVLYDIGAFDGWQSVVFSQMVGGPKNMVLIEPVTEMWSNTRETWLQNGLEPPAASFVGFAGDYDTPFATVWRNEWPGGVDYSQMLKAIKFKLMHEHADSTECLKVDTIAEFTPPPAALHIDVEGAGLKVLKGAEKTLRMLRPLVWIALHPEFMVKRFGTDPEELHEFMAEIGYRGELLAIDHEHHWLFLPEEKQGSGDCV